MSALDPTGPAPETRSVHFLWLLFGAAAAPLFWLGQLMLSYGITAQACYPGDHPQSPASTGSLFALLLGFDIAALLACAAGAAVSWRSWRQPRRAGTPFAVSLRQSRSRFLALWGLMSSLWFFFAILFNTIASITVPPCSG